MEERVSSYPGQKQFTRQRISAKLIFKLKAITCWAIIISTMLFCGSARADKTKNDPAQKTAARFMLSSPVFADGDFIPLRYAGTDVPGGGNFSIPLNWKGAPANTKSFALLMIDTSANNFIHWGVIDIPSGINYLMEGASPMYMPPGCDEVLNGFGVPGYIGPNPDQGSGTHEYQITIYALGISIDIIKNPTLNDLRIMVNKYTLEKASLTGKFINKIPEKTRPDWE